MSEKKNGFCVTKITARNFLGIKEIEINPSGEINCVTGKNGAGKTSVLEAINIAFSGALSEKHIHKGENSAEILLDLDSFSIARKITKNGTKTLRVSNVDGFEKTKPQAYLDAIVGQFAFNPIGFAFSSEKERNEVLLKALSVKYTLEDVKKDEIIFKSDGIENKLEGLDLVNFLESHFLEERRNINRSLKVAKNTVSELEQKLPKNFKPFNQKKYDELLKQIEIVTLDEDRENSYHRDLKNSITEEKQIIIEIKQIATDLCFTEIEIKSAEKKQEEKIKTQFQVWDKFKKDLEVLKEKEKEMRESMKFFEIQTQIKQYNEKIPKGDKKSEKLTRWIEELRNDIKIRLIESADLKIPGLKFEDGKFLVNNVEIELLSESEKLKIGLEIAKKLNKDFKILCVDGVEKLDKQTLEKFSKSIQKSGFQCFMTTCHEAPINSKEIKIKI